VHRDLVAYGPYHHEVVQRVIEKAGVCVRGNHDNAAGFSVNPNCSPPYKHLAAETLRYTQHVCSQEDMTYFRSLRLHRQITISGTKFYLVHAMPTNPLFGYCPEESNLWNSEVRAVETDVLVVGHTHTPFLRIERKTSILNPGSLGQPKTGRPLACYAVWEDGKISLKEYEYPIDETIRGIREMPIEPHDQEALIAELQTAILPA
jgi:putative phosphoesterase